MFDELNFAQDFAMLNQEVPHYVRVHASKRRPCLVPSQTKLAHKSGLYRMKMLAQFKKQNSVKEIVS